MANAEFRTAAETQVCKVDTKLGLVFGFAVTCNIDGQPYFDLQDEHVPEDVMLKGAMTFMEKARVAREMHTGDQIGTVIFAFPLTAEVAKSLDLQTRTTGLLIAMKPTDDVFAKFANGTYTGFSIGGFANYEDVETETAA